MRDNYSWEETIEMVRSDPKYTNLIKTCYLFSALKENVESFRASEEFNAVLRLIRENSTNAISILDVGCGSGFTSIAFALEGFDVHAVDPDPSSSVGIGAVEILRSSYGLNNIKSTISTAEDLIISGKKFDIVYCRQAMHHADDLTQFIGNLSSFLKHNGILLTIRDHVIYNSKDKDWFLETHPLHKFYGGENAYTHEEYTNAMRQSGLKVAKVMKHFDSVINFYPTTINELETLIPREEKRIKETLRNKLGIFGSLKIVELLYKRFRFNPKRLVDEKRIPGRMYSYIAVKK